MSRRVFRSPSSTTVAQAAAPSQLAHQVEGRARWRRCSDGTLEVVTLTSDSRLELFRIEVDGSATPLPVPRSTVRPWALPTMLLGVVLFIGTALLMGTQDPDGTGEHPVGLLVVLTGFALIVFGGVRHFDTRDIDSQLKRAYGKDNGWQEPANLHGWTPRTAAQLAAVEQLADVKDGVAYVRDVGARTIEVYTQHEGRYEHFWIDEDGRAELIDSASARGRYLLGIVLGITCLCLFVVVFVSAIALKHHKGLVLLIAIGGIFVTMIAGARNDYRMSVGEYVKSLPSAGGEWHEIRTWVEENDGG